MNMKKSTIAIVTAAVFLFGAESCKKEKTSTVDSNSSLIILQDETIDSQIEALGNYIEDPFVSDVNEIEELDVIGVPNELSLDYFYGDDESTGALNGKLDSIKYRDSLKKNCVKLKLSKAQIIKLKLAYKEKWLCMKAGVKTIKEKDSITKDWASKDKKTYLDAYKLKFAAIEKAYQSGKITDAEKKEQIASLKKELAEYFVKLKKNAITKIKDQKERKMSAEDIKKCEKIYLTKVYEILGKEKYILWIKWHKMIYKKK